MIDSKQTFESHLRSVAASASLRISILRKSRSVFKDRSIVSCCFWSFILPVLENCSPVWMFAAVCLCLIGSFRVHLVLVVVLFAVICGTETELSLCVCSVLLMILLVILRCSQLVVLHAIILLCTPSLLCVLDVAHCSARVRFFLLVICRTFSDDGLGAFKTSVNSTLRVQFP